MAETTFTPNGPEFRNFMRDIGMDTRDFVTERIRPLLVRLADAEARIKLLEARGNGGTQHRTAVPSSAPLDAHNLADIVLEAIQTVAEPLHNRISNLERRAATPGCEYAGVFDATKSYKRGQLITKGGGLWLCLNDVSPGGELPGSSVHFKLVVKSGGA